MGGFFLYLSVNGWIWNAPLDWFSSLYKEATTVTLSAIVMAQIANVFACRSERLSIARLGFFGNPLILLGIAVELGLLLMMVYTPLGHWLLATASLPGWIWGILAAGAVGLLLAEEIRKAVIDRFNRRRATPCGSLTTSSPEI